MCRRMCVSWVVQKGHSLVLWLHTSIHSWMQAFCASIGVLGHSPMQAFRLPPGHGGGVGGGGGGGGVQGQDLLVALMNSILFAAYIFLTVSYTHLTLPTT